MKIWIRQIFAIIILVPFLLSTSGIVFYNSYCSCTGNIKAGIYFAPKTCSHHHNRESGKLNSCCAGNASACKANHKDCQCDSLKTKFAKLDSKVITSATANFISVDINNSIFRDLEKEWISGLYEVENLNLSYIEPPPKFLYHNDLLNVICQLKIPAIV